MLKPVVTALLIVAAVGVNSSLVAQGDQDARELAAYRLTRTNFDKYVTAMRALAAEVQKNPAYQEMTKVQAEINALQEKDELTDAQQARLDLLEERKEALDDSLGAGLNVSDGRDLNDMEARIKASRAVAAALRAADFPPLEYAKFTLVLFQTTMAAGFKKAGMLKDLPKEVSAENLKFVEDNAATFEAMQKEMEALGPPKDEQP